MLQSGPIPNKRATHTAKNWTENARNLRTLPNDETLCGEQLWEKRISIALADTGVSLKYFCNPPPAWSRDSAFRD